MNAKRSAAPLRGKPTPFQLWLACVLGSLAAFVPGVSEHLPLLTCLAMALLVFNTNVPLALAVAASMRLVALQLVPSAFILGQWLLDGPGRALAGWAVEAPVLALFELDRYAVAGGLVLGGGLGCVLGLLAVLSWRAFVSAVVLAESDGGRGGILRHGLTHVGLWLLVGPRRGRDTWSRKLTAPGGSGVRPSGVALLMVMAALVWLAPVRMTESLLAHRLRTGLERWNGARVDLGGLRLDLERRTLTLRDLALADAAWPGRDLLRVGRVEADVTAWEPLRGRLALGRAVLTDVTHAGPRPAPGRAVGPPPTPEALPPAAVPPPGVTQHEWELNPLLLATSRWPARLAQAREWLQALSVEGGLRLGTLWHDERVARGLRDHGYSHVRALGLRSRPALLVDTVLAEAVHPAGTDGPPWRLELTSLCSEPELLPSATVLSLGSPAAGVQLELGLGGRTRKARDNRVRLSLRDVPGEALSAVLSIDGVRPLRDGTLDVELEGSWWAGRVAWVDLPVTVTLRDATLQLGTDGYPVDSLVLRLGLRGPLDNLRVVASTPLLRDALVVAAWKRLERELDGDRQALLDRFPERSEGGWQRPRGQGLSDEEVEALQDALRAGRLVGESDGGGR